jgi:hypothetical protein
MMLVILLSTIPLRNLLTRDEPDKRLALSELPAEIRAKGYHWHISLYVFMYAVKLIIDHHGEPMKARVGGYTHWIHGLEGEFTLLVQETFRNDLLTDVLSFHYLFLYLFVIWFLPMYMILVRDHVMADKAALNYLTIYILAIPLYLFFNIEVTSSYIPGMDALLYHDSFYLEFFTNNDPMDNGIPSLHFGLPIGLLIINRLHVRELGISIREWRHREFDLFIQLNLVIYLFSIQYLGIHWIVDIVPGVILAVICAVFVHAWQPRIRARLENGWKSLIPERRSLTTAAVFALLCTSALAVFAVDGAGTEEDTPNIRFGPGDVNIDTIEVHSLWDPVGVEVRNVGEAPVYVVIVDRSHVVPHTDRGFVDWDSIVASSRFRAQSRLPERDPRCRGVLGGRGQYTLNLRHALDPLQSGRGRRWCGRAQNHHGLRRRRTHLERAAVVCAGLPHHRTRHRPGDSTLRGRNGRTALR